MTLDEVLSKSKKDPIIVSLFISTSNSFLKIRELRARLTGYLSSIFKQTPAVMVTGVGPHLYLEHSAVKL